MCWQDCRDIREETAVAVNKGCLDITTAGIVGVSYWCTVLCVALCWCWQCLLTVGGNLLPHTVTPLDVTTWHGAVDRPRTFYTLQNSHQEH